MTGQTGAGFTINTHEKGKVEGHFPLGKSATVYQAEVLAILHGAKAAHDLNPQWGVAVDILCDNQAALYNLDKTHSKSALVQECHKTLNLLAEKRPVTLRWVPGHEGIDGNERADHLAKIGSSTEYIGPEPSLPVSREHIKNTIKKWCFDSWEKRWRMQAVQSPHP